MKRVLSSLLLAAVCAPSFAQTAREFTLPLTADGAAHMVVYLPEQPTGRAVVCCPGGGYAVLSNTHEGAAWHEYFNGKGIAFVLVNYRIPHGDRTLPITDVETAMRTVRDSAARWSINPHDVGIMGSSAGGHLASTITTHSEFALRPDFQILVYPVITMGEGTHQGSLEGLLGDDRNDPDIVRLYSNQYQVKSSLTPPAILLLADDDALVPPVPNAIAYYSAMRDAGNSCSLHVYPSGGHGFGYMPFFAYREQMLSDLSAWLDKLPAPKQDAIRVACIGDSITEGYGLDLRSVNGYPARMQKFLGDKYWVKNFGVSARTMLSTGDFPYMNETAWQDALAFNPDVVVIKLGTNDTKGYNWTGRKAFAKDLEKMVKTLQALPSNPKIYLCTPIPAFKPGWTINEELISGEVIPALEKAVKKYGLAGLIDLHATFEGQEDLVLPDGIHPNGNGARKLAETVAKVIDPDVKIPQGGRFPWMMN